MLRRMLRPHLALALIPFALLALFFIVRPVDTQGAPASQSGAGSAAPVEAVSEAPMELVSDAPVCVRYYPATGETREGPEICATRPGDPPPVERQGAPADFALAPEHPEHPELPAQPDPAPSAAGGA
jgi:hypothetical protein